MGTIYYNFFMGKSKIYYKLTKYGAIKNQNSKFLKCLYKIFLNFNSELISWIYRTIFHFEAQSHSNTNQYK